MPISFATRVRYILRSSASRLCPKVCAGLKLFDYGAAAFELYANVVSGIKNAYAFSDFYANVAANSALVPDLTVSTLRRSEIGVGGESKS